MALTLDDALDGVRSSRRYFRKHLTGLREDQWDWKPNAECKNIRETLVHLICNDRAALQSMQTGKEPDYESFQETERDPERLCGLLAESFEDLQAYIKTRYADAPLDTEVSVYGSPLKLARAVSHLSAEDFYHAGQVAYIRIATDPTWDYYSAIYGAEE